MSVTTSLRYLLSANRNFPLETRFVSKRLFLTSLDINGVYSICNLFFFLSRWYFRYSPSSKSTNLLSIVPMTIAYSSCSLPFVIRTSCPSSGTSRSVVNNNHLHLYYSRVWASTSSYLLNFSSTSANTLSIALSPSTENSTPLFSYTSNNGASCSTLTFSRFCTVSSESSSRCTNVAPSLSQTPSVLGGLFNTWYVVPHSGQTLLPVSLATSFASGTST